MSRRKPQPKIKTSNCPDIGVEESSQDLETRWAALYQQEDRSDLTPEQAARYREIDEELTLTFLTEYLALEQALVRAGFVRVGRMSGISQPDWERFARHIERHFHRDCSEDLDFAVRYLLLEKDSWHRRMARIQNTFAWEDASPRSDVVWLTELIQQTHKRLTHSVSHTDQLDFGFHHLMSALFVVEALAHIDPRVESLLEHLH